MTIDLKTLKPGDVVHFRSGGEAEIQCNYGDGHEWLKPFTFAFTEFGETYTYWNGNWSGCGPSGNFRNADPHPMDIVRVTKKAFDWDTVEPGMAFINKMDREIQWYIGDLLIKNSDSIVVTRNWKKPGTNVLWTTNPSYLTRAEEHDIK